MSKKLESILSKVPPATASSNIDEKNKEKIAITSFNPYKRVVAVIPQKLKQEIKIYIAKNPGETEKSIILKGLKALGFEVSDKDIMDQRGKF